MSSPSNEQAGLSQAENVATAFKRRRTAVACETCRRRKTRCSGSHPSCQQCAQLGLRCRYNSPANHNESSRDFDHHENDRQSLPRTHDDRLEAIEDALRSVVPGFGQGESPLRSPVIRETAVNGRICESPLTSARIETVHGNVATVRRARDEDKVDGLPAIGERIDEPTRFFGMLK